MTQSDYSREARRAERARVVRLSRLPFLYDFSLRGRPYAVAAVLLQSAIAIALALVVCRAVSGEWLPRWALFVVLAVSLGLQALARFLNARAGRT
jgi:hypothetical protein